MAEVNELGNEKGSVFLVDPNPPGMDIIPPEDMFIYVKFSAYPRSRATYGGNTLEGDPIVFDSGVEGEVHFISTKISYKDGKLDPPLQKSYATTDWTNIGGFKDEDSRSAGILEGFGIKSIDIKYNASLVPVVDITFTDVRGSGLFDVIKNNDRKSPYSVFFKMPYPVFKLSVKGYFGQKVDYCLHMVNWTSNFDGSTGNFDITANFLGFQQAFLNDMVIGNVIGTVNTEKGFENLNNIYNESETGREINPEVRKIDDFFTKIAKLQVESEIIKSELDSFELLKDLNGKLSLLKTIRSFIGSHMGKAPKTKNGENEESVPYVNRQNSEKRIFTSKINDNNLQNNVNYLSIRDYIVFNSVDRGSFKRYIETLTDLIKTYEEYLTKNNIKNVKPVDGVESQKEKKLSNGSSSKNERDSQLIDSFFRTGDESKNWESYIDSITKDDGNITPVKLETIIEQFSNSGSTLFLKSDYVDSNDNNKNFNLESFKQTQFYNNLKKETTVLVADFRKQRELVEWNIVELEEELKIQREKVQSEINEKLTKNFEESFGFNPTISKCFEIIANNTQAMVETIYDITKLAEDKSKSDARSAALDAVETDLPVDVDSLGWPSVYQKNSDGALEEIYIGELNVTESDFPELKFTEDVFENLVAKSKTLEEVTRATVLKNGLDTDNWFPINPIDYEINPWIKLGVLTNEPEITEEIVKQIFYRSALLENYSLFDKNTGLGGIDKYVNLEAIAANKTIFSKPTREIIGNILKKLKDGTIDYKNTEFFKQNIEDQGSKFLFNETESNLPTYNDFKLSGLYSPDAKYVLYDDKKIINNSKRLYKEIEEDVSYSKLVDRDSGNVVNKKETGDILFYKNFYKNNNLTTNNIFNVWDKSVSKNLFISNGNDITENFGTSTKLLDFNPSGNTYGSKYLNITNFNSGVNPSEESYEFIMTQSELYRKQNSDYAKALLLLSTYPFRTFKEGFLDSVFPTTVFKGARIVKIPKLYLYYIGGLLWRYQQGLENKPSIDFNVTVGSGTTTYSKFATSYDKYLNLGYNRIDGSKEINLEDSLKTLPSSVKTELIDKFKNWADLVIDDLRLNLTYYVNNGETSGFAGTITDKEVKSGKDKIFSDNNYGLKNISDMIILNPTIFDKELVNNPTKLSVDQGEINQYINLFSTKFEAVEKENENGSESSSEEEKRDNNKSTNKIKLQIYNYFKNINSKWVGQDKRSYNICGGDGEKNLIDYFRFVDRGWRCIGDEASFNLKSFLTLGSNLNTSVYFFISKLLRDSNFLFQILPTYINYKNAEEVKKIFRPQTTLQKNDSTGPIYCCIYVGTASEVLDIEETRGSNNNYLYSNDGWDFKNGGANIPADIKDNGGGCGELEGTKNSSLVAFKVGFGAQNQTIFKNLSLSQQEHRETGEYFKALSDLVDKRGGTQKTYVGTDLLRLFKTRSYTCKVDALGCMNIQPLMYFDLQNVPFFNGAYLITSVNHQITPNHMTTNFQGVRQSKYISAPQKAVVADLNLDLNESSEVPKIEFTNLNIKSGRFNIGVRTGIDPDDLFDFEGNFTVGNFKLLGVIRDDDSKYQELADTLTVLFRDENDITTNSQVTMLLTAMMANSNNLNQKEKDVTKGTEIRDGGNNIYTYTNTPEEFNTDSLVVKYKDSYLSSISVVSGNTNVIAYQLEKNADLDETKIYENILNDIENINQNISTETDPTKKSNLQKRKEELEKKKENLINDTTYFNIFPGDAYRFRQRGYLYLIGRKNYHDLIDKLNVLSFTGEQVIKNPNTVTTNESSTINASIAVWKGIEDKTDENKRTAYGYSSIKDDGSAATFKRCYELVYQSEGPDDSETFDVFEKVLTLFKGKDGQPLIDFDKARGII
jgi:hypothetical protein